MRWSGFAGSGIKVSHIFLTHAVFRYYILKMKTDEELSAQIMRIINQFIFLEKKYTFKYKNITLFPSEIHLLMLIFEGSSVNATVMAEKMGVTKGAISQTLSRLEKKKLITKEKDPFNKNVITVKFTPAGLNALKSFSETRVDADKKFQTYLSSLAMKERAVIEEFLTQMQSFIKDLT
jgi:DNA-binding MarR family transcriptional regulator